MKTTSDMERLTYRLNLLARLAIDANDQIFKDNTGLSIREIRVLRLIEDNPGITFVELNEAANLERSLTSRIIQTLLKADLARRENDAADSRRFRLFSTPAGQAVRAKAHTISDRLEEILLRPLDKDEVAALDARLARLADWVRSPDYREALSDWLDPP